MTRTSLQRIKSLRNKVELKLAYNRKIRFPQKKKKVRSYMFSSQRATYDDFHKMAVAS